MKLLAKCIGFIAVFISGCTPKMTSKNNGVEISILIDATDSFTLQPDTTLFSLFNLSENPGLRAKYRIGMISDRLYTETRELEIADLATTEAQNTTDDVLHRQKCILQFYKRFEEDLHFMQLRSSLESSLPYSLCYQKIEEEIIRLSNDSGGSKTLIVFSDLLEKSEIINCYSPIVRNVLQCCPDSVISLFEKYSHLPPDLHNLQVYIYHQPMTREEDAIFKKLVNVYSALIENRGGKLSVQANINTLPGIH